MRARNVFLLVVVLATSLFAWLNWPVFQEVKTLSLLITKVEAPFGVVMLTVMSVLLLVYFLYAVGLEAAALLEVKKYARELLASRKLADEAEASRFTELRKYLEAELVGLKSQAGGTTNIKPLLDRLDQLEHTLRDQMEKSGNILAAYIGELEDQITGQDRHPGPSKQ